MDRLESATIGMATLWTVIAGGLTVLGFLWVAHRDISDRIVKLEVKMDIVMSQFARGDRPITNAGIR